MRPVKSVPRHLRKSIFNFPTRSYKSVAQIKEEMRNPSPDIINLTPKKEGLEGLQRGRFCKIIKDSSNKIKFTPLEEGEKADIIVLTGINSGSNVMSAMARGAARLITGSDILGKNTDLHDKATIVTYLPQDEIPEGYQGLLKFQLDQSHITNDAKNIAQQLPQITNQDKPTIITSFSFGSQLMSMAVNSLLESMKEKGCSENEIREVTNNLLLCNFGATTIHWGKEDNNSKLLPFTLQCIDTKDQGIKHSIDGGAHTRYNDEVLENEYGKSTIYIEGNKKRMLVVPSTWAIASAPATDHHNIANYIKFALKDPTLLPIIRSFYRGQIPSFLAKWQEISNSAEPYVAGQEISLEHVKKYEEFTKKFAENIERFGIEDKNGFLSIKLGEGAEEEFSEAIASVYDLDPRNPDNYEVVGQCAAKALEDIIPPFVIRLIKEALAKKPQFRSRNIFRIGGSPIGKVPFINDQGDGLLYPDSDYLIGEFSTVGFMRLMGLDLVPTPNIASGHHGMHDIYLRKKDEGRKNANAEIILLHLEVSHEEPENRPQLVTLLCKNNYEGSENIGTRFHCGIIFQLPEEIISGLKTDFIFHGGDVTLEDQDFVGPVINDEGEIVSLNINPGRMTATTTEGEKSLEYVKMITEKKYNDQKVINANPGDKLIFIADTGHEKDRFEKFNKEEYQKDKVETTKEEEEDNKPGASPESINKKPERLYKRGYGRQASSKGFN